MENGIIHISFLKTKFKCPHCKKKYDDSENVYLEKCNKNKSGYTKIKCKCEMRFGMTYDYTGNAVSFKITNK